MKPASCLAAMLLMSLAAPNARAVPAAIGAWGVDLSDADPAVRPGDDFYLSRNGGWYARHPPTPAQPRSAYWLDLRRAPSARLATIMEGLAADATAPPTGIRGKVAAFYRAALDAPGAEARGVTPLAPRLAAIRRATNRAALAHLMGEADGPDSLRPVNGIGLRTSPSLFAVEIRQDQRDPGRYAVYLGQAGLMLPGPEYAPWRRPPGRPKFLSWTMTCRPAPRPASP